MTKKNPVKKKAAKKASLSGAARRRKGGDGERELAAALRDLGFAAKRGLLQVRGGGQEESDVTDVEISGRRLHIECKRQAHPPIGAAYKQAKMDVARRDDDRVPVAMTKADRAKDWLVTISLTDFAALLTPPRAASTEGPIAAQFTESFGMAPSEAELVDGEVQRAEVRTVTAAFGEDLRQLSVDELLERSRVIGTYEEEAGAPDTDHEVPDMARDL